MSLAMKEKLQNILEYCLVTKPFTEELYSVSSVKEYISILSRTVHTATSPAVAHSAKSKDYDAVFANILNPAHTSPTYQMSTETMFSYTSSYINGRMSEKYGLEENYSDYRVQIKVYDKKRASMEQPNQFWKAKVREIDLTLPRNSSIMKKVDSTKV